VDQRYRWRCFAVLVMEVEGANLIEPAYGHGESYHVEGVVCGCELDMVSIDILVLDMITC
jgi:hypothetical protein